MTRIAVGDPAAEHRPGDRTDGRGHRPQRQRKRRFFPSDMSRAESLATAESTDRPPRLAASARRAGSAGRRDAAQPRRQHERRIAQTNSLIWPTRCVSQPVSGIDIALAAANSVITQVPSSTDTPRLPAMVGIATFAIDESSTFMKVASATASREHELAAGQRRECSGIGRLIHFITRRKERRSERVPGYLTCQLIRQKISCLR
jgi:hypothetical protein